MNSHDERLNETERWLAAVVDDPTNDLHWDEVACGAIERARWLVAEVKRLRTENDMMTKRAKPKMRSADKARRGGGEGAVGMEAGAGGGEVMKPKRKRGEWAKGGLEYWLRGGDDLWRRGYWDRGENFVPLTERENAWWLLPAAIFLVAVVPFGLAYDALAWIRRSVKHKQEG